VKTTLSMDHRHVPVCRVVRRGWGNPLDASFSRRHGNRRWNTAAFPALYCCCSERVARAVVRDLFRAVGVEMDEIQPEYQPQLADITWSGRVVDVSTPEGVTAAGLAGDYPRDVLGEQTREAAARWHSSGAEGVVCRSASMSRAGLVRWTGPHEAWSELVIFVDNAARKPELLRRREDEDWLG